MPSYEVKDSVDVFHVQRCVAKFARDMGFSKREGNELAIVASELTSNILKYGVRGSIQVDVTTDATGTGLMLTASDCGPPFHDLAAAQRDGWDDHGPIDPLQMLKRKGIGGGLGAVVRLTHSFKVETDSAGKRVSAVRYLRRPLVGAIR